MVKIYKVDKKYLFMPIIVGAVILLISYNVPNLKYNTDLIWILFACLVGLSFGIYTEIGQVIISDEGIEAGINSFIFSSGIILGVKKRALQWNQIRSIEYVKGFFLKSVYIYPLGGKMTALARRIRIYPLIKGYKELLRDIITRTYDETKIDPKVVELAGMKIGDLPDRRTTTYLKVEE